MPLPLMIHSALALFAQRTRIPTSARSTGFCVIWVCISSSSSSTTKRGEKDEKEEEEEEEEEEKRCDDTPHHS